MQWEITIIALSIVGGLWWLRNEYVRPNRARLVSRLVAVTLSSVALAGLGLNITYQRQQPSTAGTPANLVTQGYSPDSLERYGSRSFVTEDTSIYRALDSLRPRLIPTVSYFLATHPEVEQLHVFGYGPEDPSMLTHNAGRQFYFHPGEMPSGTVSVNWPPSIITGEAWHIQGTYFNDRPEPVKLLLEGLSTPLDSVRVPGQQRSAFQLKTTPQYLGRAVYRLLAVSGQDTLQDEPVPVQVKPRTPLRVLVLNSTPDFETKFLKNWLYENGQTVAVRQKISQDLYSREFLNMDQMALDRLDENTLAKFDLLVADQMTLQALTPAENRVFQQRVQQGTGLLIRSNGTPPASPFVKNFRLLEEPVQSVQTFKVRLLNMPDTTIRWRAAQSWYVKPTNQTPALVKDDKGRGLAASRLYGRGKLVLTTLTGSQQLVLEGCPEAFSQLWTTLINAALSPQPVSRITVDTNVPVVHHSYSVTVQSSQPQPTVRLADAPIYLQQSVRLPFRWTGTFWPQHAGWNYWTDARQDTTFFYVFEEEDWQPTRWAERLAQTRRAISQQKPVALSGRGAEKSRAEVPKIYFFLVFLVCCSFLWWENKIS